MGINKQYFGIVSSLAQLAERAAVNRKVGGSIPPGRVFTFLQK